MRRRRDEREADERERPRSDETDRPPDAAESLLALQRSAGNRAVSALVARAPDDKKDVDKAEGGTATLEGIGPIPISSVSFPPGRTGAGGSGGSRDEASPHELVLTSKVGEHSANLLKAAGDGRQMAVEIVAPGKGALHLKLTGAIVGTYQTSGQGPDAMESWTLNFTTLERTTEEGEREKAR